MAELMTHIYFIRGNLLLTAPSYQLICTAKEMQVMKMKQMLHRGHKLLLITQYYYIILEKSHPSEIFSLLRLTNVDS